MFLVTAYPPPLTSRAVLGVLRPTNQLPLMSQASFAEGHLFSFAHNI